MMSHYSKCPIETAEAFNDDWLKTGDYGYVKGNKVHIIGRIKVSILYDPPWRFVDSRASGTHQSAWMASFAHRD